MTMQITTTPEEAKDLLRIAAVAAYGINVQIRNKSATYIDAARRLCALHTLVTSIDLSFDPSLRDHAHKQANRWLAHAAALGEMDVTDTRDVSKE